MKVARTILTALALVTVAACSESAITGPSDSLPDVPVYEEAEEQPAVGSGG